MKFKKTLSELNLYFIWFIQKLNHNFSGKSSKMFNSIELNISSKKKYKIFELDWIIQTINYSSQFNLSFKLLF